MWVGGKQGRDFPYASSFPTCLQQLSLRQVETRRCELSYHLYLTGAQQQGVETRCEAGSDIQALVLGCEHPEWDLNCCARPPPNPHIKLTILAFLFTLGMYFSFLFQKLISTGDSQACENPCCQSRC